MTERQNEGAGFGAQDREAMEWRLETLHRRSEEGVRELGARVLDMYHHGSVDLEVVREHAAKLDELAKSAMELETAMRGETGPSPDRPRPAPVVRPVMGAADPPMANKVESPAEGAAAEPPANGERDEGL